MRIGACTLALGLGLLAQGCASPGSPPGETKAQAATIWDYLQTKYDVDGDGRVLAAEYDRGSDTFSRLDSDHDGVLTGGDFESGDQMRMSPEQMAPFLLMRYFQADEQADLGRDEATGRLAALDADGDGKLQREESSDAFAAAGGPMMGMDAFGILLQAGDEDGDKSLSPDELLVLFDRVDSDGNGVLTMPGHGMAMDAGPPEGARPGDMAPDFTLSPDHGGAPVTLSSFRAEQPVALIFGSYT